MKRQAALPPGFIPKPGSGPRACAAHLCQLTFPMRTQAGPTCAAAQLTRASRRTRAADPKPSPSPVTPGHPFSPSAISFAWLLSPIKAHTTRLQALYDHGGTDSQGQGRRSPPRRRQFPRTGQERELGVLFQFILLAMQNQRSQAPEEHFPVCEAARARVTAKPHRQSHRLSAAASRGHGGGYRGHLMRACDVPGCG